MERKDMSTEKNNAPVLQIVVDDGFVHVPMLNKYGDKIGEFAFQPTDVDIEYCEQVEEMGEDSAIIQFKRLPAVPKALCMKHVGPYERFYESFIEAFRYIEEKGYKPVGQHRTCYVDGAWNQQDPEKWLSIIQIPIE